MTVTNIVRVDGFEFQYKDNEYINLTKMCKDSGKRLDNALRLKEIIEYKTVLARYLECEESELLVVQKGGIPNQQGTYGHPLFAIRIGQWCSNDFAIAVSKLTQSYLKADISIVEGILANKESLTSEESRAIFTQTVNKSSEKDQDWMEARLSTRHSNKLLNSELRQCFNTSRAVYSKSQDAIAFALTGSSTKAIKAVNNLPERASAREGMTTEELISLSFTEMLASKRIAQLKPEGDNNCAEVCGNTGKMVKEFSDDLINR
jgi:hypothetical protein